MTFRLFDKPTNMLSLDDYGVIVRTVLSLEPKRVIEFGPGSSTLALIEGGAWRIEACEDSSEWLGIYCKRITDPRVRFHKYEWSPPISIPALDEERFDLGLIDGPYDIERRFPIIKYCIKRCKAVLIPLETSHGNTLRDFIYRQPHRALDIMTTGPLAGAWALLTT